MSEKALSKFKDLVDKIDIAFRIGPTEGEAVLDDFGPKLAALGKKMNQEEHKQAKKYLDLVTKDNANFELQDIMEDDMGDMEDEDEEDVEDEMEDCEEGCPKCARINITYDRRRELTKMAMELAELIDTKQVAREERAYLLTMLDNLAD